LGITPFIQLTEQERGNILLRNGLTISELVWGAVEQSKQMAMMNEEYDIEEESMETTCESPGTGKENQHRPSAG